MLSRIVDEPGFVSARLLETDEHSWIAVVVEMSTAADRRRLELLPEVRETLHHLHGMVNVITKLYHEIAAYRR